MKRRYKERKQKTPEALVKQAIKDLAPHIGLRIWSILGGLGQTPGIPDFLGIFKGRPVAIEAKAGKNRLSKDQVLFKEEWERHGGIFIEAHSPDDVVKGLGLEGVFLF